MQIIQKYKNWIFLLLYETILAKGGDGPKNQIWDFIIIKCLLV
jgi:hypothetical protein